MLFMGLTKDSDIWYDVWSEINSNTGQRYVKQHTHLFNRRKRISDAKPGQIFEFVLADGKDFCVKLDHVQYMGLWLNAKDLAKWQAEYRAVCEVWEQETAKKKDGLHNWDLEAIRPIREAYHSLNDSSKEILLANVISFIVRPKKKKKK